MILGDYLEDLDEKHILKMQNITQITVLTKKGGKKTDLEFDVVQSSYISGDSAVEKKEFEDCNKKWSQSLIVSIMCIPLIWTNAGFSYDKAKKNRQKVKKKVLIDTGIQLSVTRLKLHLLSGSSVCAIVGFNGAGNVNASVCRDVSFEISEN